MSRMPLTMVRVGDINIIQKVGGKEETRKFLENLGFVVGAEVAVLSIIGGNVIVSIKDSRIAINSDMAKHIMVSIK
ncbi:FeoA domain protein [Clostridiales bacterium CHKCI001]|nr:FeoA domain protein [Clostridiales bacterium CHKCI001]